MCIATRSTAARSGVDTSVFADDLVDDLGAPLPFTLQTGEYEVAKGSAR